MTERIHADRPIHAKSEDLLGRAPFAAAIGRAIREWNGDDSLVIAITGEWGSGKSSLKNLVVESLAESTATKTPIDILPLNVWAISGTGEIEAAFFGEIDRFFARPDRTARDKAIAQRWQAYVELLKVPEALIDPLVKPVSGALLTLGLTTAALTGEDWRLELTGYGVALLGYLLAASSKIAESVSGWFGNRAQRSARSAAQLKADLTRELRARDASILIVLDDLDRLSPDELRLVFRLVKANADLPKLIFLLCFDQTVIEKALDLEGHCKGSEYLEKIVQIRFNVPSVDRTRLLDVLIARFNDILRDLPDSPKLDQRRWVDLFFQHLHGFFDNLRDVYRFTASLEFHAGAFRSGASLEVNILDLFALEAIRLFQPKVYAALADHKTLLTHGQLTRWDSDSHNEKAKEAIQSLVGLSDDDRRNAVQETLTELFPRIGWASGGHSYGDGFESGWTTERRVCSEVHFDKYFQLALPQGEISQAELDEIVGVSHDRAATKQIFETMKSDGRLTRLIVRLEYERDRIPSDNIAPFITALFDVGDDLPAGEDMWVIDADLSVVGIVYRMAQGLKNETRADHALLQAVRETTGLLGPAYFVALEERTPGKDKKYAITNATLPECQKLCLARIKDAAAKGTLLHHPKLNRLLWWWVEWAGEAEVKEWCNAQIITPAHGLILLKKMITIRHSQGMGSLYTSKQPMIQLDALEKLVDPATLAANIGELAPGQIDTDGALAIQALHRALRRRQQGRGHDVLSVDLEDDDEE